jgi:hypothetical protein
MARDPRGVHSCDAARAPGMLIDEHIRPDGGLIRTHLHAAGADRVRIVADDGTHGELSVGAIDKVMRRYGRPLEAGLSADGESVALGDHRLARLRFKAVVDADARDYLVWHPPGDEPLAALATTIAAALRYLVLRLAEERTR